MIVGNMAPIASDLVRDYRLKPASLRPHPGGFESDCFVSDQRWFVKVWRGKEAPADLGRLSALQAAGLPVPAPIRTVTGGLSEDRLSIAAYLGASPTFEEALADFADAYARQNERDYSAFQHHFSQARPES